MSVNNWSCGENEGVCLGEKLTIGGQNSPGPKIIVIIDHNDLLLVSVRKQIGQKFEGFCPVVLVGSKICQVITKKKPHYIYYHFLPHSFKRFCSNLNQMLLDSFIYTTMKLNFCGVLAQR